MLLYETLILSNTNVTKDEFSSIEDFFDKITSDVGGLVKSFDKWGKYRLSYPIKKNEYGVYSLVRYELPKDKAQTVFKELDSFFKIKCNDIVFRFVTKKLDSTTFLEYKRPEPVDSRSGNLDSFIKENKMDKFLDGNYSKNKNTVSQNETEQKESTETVENTVDKKEEN